MTSQCFGMIGQFGPAQLACLRSWRRQGAKTVFFQLGGREVSPRLRGFADVYRFYPTGMALQDLLPDISRECETLAVTGIASLSESHAKLLNAHQADGGFARTLCMLNTPAVYELLESKLGQAAIAQRAGLPVMPTYFIGPDQDDVPDDAGALVLRPDVARLVRPAFKARLVQSAAEARAVAAGLQRTDFKLIAQAFVPGPNLIIHAARAADGSWDHHEAFFTEIKSDGLAVSLRPWPIPPELLQSCRNFEKETQIRGVFHYDFILDEKTKAPYFLEVNPRLGGTTAKVYAAGYDEPAMLLAAFTQPGVHRVELGGKRVASVSRIAAARVALSALARKPSVLDYPRTRSVGMFGRLAWSLAAYPDELLAWSDPVGNLAWLSQAKSD